MGATYLGPERNATCFSLKTYQAEGFSIAGGSDATAYWPVDSLRDLASMVTRTTYFGNKYNEGEALTYHEAVRAQTKDAAWVGFEEHRAGTLEAAKIADICVLDRDPDTCPPDELPSMPVALTVCAGRITYRTI
jgi:predicted amidohydrolase YtcJ